MPRTSHTPPEYGDFQTPDALASAICARLAVLLGPQAAVVEPTCGRGAFLVAARRQWGSGCSLLGVEFNDEHLKVAHAALNHVALDSHTALVQADFFAYDWERALETFPAPLLVLGNPPWVTNSAQGAEGGENLPPKLNIAQQRGLDALTGASNFDISEWMVWRLLSALWNRPAAVAMLVKTSVARRLLARAWMDDHPLGEAHIFRINAQSAFGATVDACLFVARTNAPGEHRCAVYAELGAQDPVAWIGGRPDGSLVAHEAFWDATRHLERKEGAKSQLQWRSGIKHDCAKVFELRAATANSAVGGLVNGLGEEVCVEPHTLYPLLKSSHVARGQLEADRWLLLPQTSLSAHPSELQTTAPQAWAYLQSHTDRLSARKSRIYAGRPPFSVFGVGPYSFAPWKVAISGLYKKLQFTLVPPYQGRPVLFDDTVYFLACNSELQARSLHSALCSPAATQFFQSRIFWDEKRPITAARLNALDLNALVAECGG